MDGVIRLDVVGEVDPLIAQGLADVFRRATEATGAVESVGDASAKAAPKHREQAKAATDLANTWTELKSKIDLVTMAFGAVVSAADGIANVAAEQARLDSATQRLGIDFNTAAASAGRFVDETDAMAAASRFAEAGLRLTQEQVNALTTRGAQLSQNLGIDMPAAFDKMFAAVVAGESEALRPFGAAMTALGGPTHTAEERLAALVTQARALPQATDDAATSMARLRDRFGDMQRTATDSFAASFRASQELSDALDRAGGGVDDTEDKLRALGTLAHDVIFGIGNVVGVAIGSIGTFISGTVAMLGNLATAVERLAARDWQGARAALTSRSGATWDATQAVAEWTAQRGAAWSMIASGESSAEARSAMSRRDARNDGATSTMTFTEDEVRGRRRAASSSSSGGGNDALDRLYGQGQTAAFAWMSQRELDRLYGQGQTAAFAWMSQREADAAREADAIAERARADAEHEIERAASEADAEQRRNTERRRDLRNRELAEAESWRDRVSDAFSTVASAAQTAFKAVADGQIGVAEGFRQMAVSIVDTLVQLSLKKGLFELAEGIAAAIWNPPAAAAHFASSAVYLGLAAAGGLASAGLGALGPGSSSAGATAGPVAPVNSPGTSSGSDRGGSTTIVNHYYSPVIGGREATDSDVGDQLSRYEPRSRRRRS